MQRLLLSNLPNLKFLEVPKKKTKTAPTNAMPEDEGEGPQNPNVRQKSMAEAMEYLRSVHVLQFYQSN